MVTISMRMPADVIEDLKRIAPLLGMSGYQPLIRFFIAKGLRESMAALHGGQWERLAEALRRQGMSDEQIADVIYEARNGTEARDERERVAWNVMLESLVQAESEVARVR